jgi:hypothetical protein
LKDVEDAGDEYSYSPPQQPDGEHGRRTASVKIVASGNLLVTFEVSLC